MIITIENQFCKRSIEFDELEHENIHYEGMIDSHGHIVWLGMKHLGLDLEGCKSSKEVIEKTMQYASENDDDWIIGRAWNNELWQPDDCLSLEQIDKHFPNKPIYLKRIDGHAAWVNSLALKLANIDMNTSDPTGGTIKRDQNGKPTGELVDNAMELVNQVLPKHSIDQLKKYILTGIDKLAELGVTHTCDMDVHLEWYQAFKELAEENLLKIQIDQYYRGFDNKWQAFGLKPHSINNLNVCGLKYFADGAIGSRGAALLEPYSDDPSNKGLFLIESNELYEKAKLGAEAGFEIATHAIGDAANRMVLNVYGKLRNDGINNKLRIEHAQMVHPNDLYKFKEYKIEAHVQSTHCTSDEKMAEKRLGDRVQYSYPWKSLIELGIDVFGGSDYPIESHDPFLGLKSLLLTKIKWQESEIPAIESAFKIYNSYYSSSSSNTSGIV